MSTIASSQRLYEPVYRPLPLGFIRPQGWLARQLRIQANGLSGHIDEFWPDIRDSKWFGGDMDGWERAPYWLDGLIPLAWSLDDEVLKAKARLHVEQIVATQRHDGWYAPYPEGDAGKAYDIWSIFLVNKVLVQYHEATGDEAVFATVVRSLRAIADSLDSRPLFDWAKFRWYEGLIALYYVIERSPESWMLDLAKKLERQGFDYRAFFASDEARYATPRRGKWRFDRHVVNVAMALKAYPLYSRISGRSADLDETAAMLRVLDRYHGQANGMFSGDECLSGPNPLQGTELCAVVEAMFSLEQAIAMTGSTELADRLERIAFNALPATFTPDMWAHQYDQQANQVQCTINDEALWSTNFADSNIYGLEPNFGCCTANMHQAWPKFLAHLWMRDGDGLAAIGYAPNTLEVELGGAKVMVSTETDYPFREDVVITVRSDRRVRFPLSLRVPGWTNDASLEIDGRPVRLAASTVYVVDREWAGTTTLRLRFPMQTETTRRYAGSICVERGPLVYSLKIGEEWKRVNADLPCREEPHADYEVRPTTPWNYGLIAGDEIRFEPRPVGEKAFSPDGAGMVAFAKARKVPNWGLSHGWADELGLNPSSSEPIEEIELLPYGCTNLRITEFPAV